MSAAVEVHGLTKMYGMLVAVRDVELRVPEGSVFGLIGPNGAGKTTTLSVLCGWTRATLGTAQVLGCDPGDVVRLKRRRGALPQDAQMPATSTVSQALAYYAELMGLSPGDARAAAHQGLAEVGLGDALDRKCAALSHGMAKRAALAQAFLGDPEVVLLDEPTAGLDPRGSKEVRDVIAGHRGKRTVVVSSHNLAELEELCDQAAILDFGRLKFQGSMADLTGQGATLRMGLVAAPPLALVQGVAGVAEAKWDASKSELFVTLSRGEPLEEVTARLLLALLNAGARVTSLSSGRRLEEKVLELM